jgi:hypothetical protein
MRRCASKLRSNDGIQALEHLLGALWMLLTLAEGQQAKAVLGVGGKGVRLVVQLIQQAFTPAVGGTEIATSSSTTGAVQSPSDSIFECEARTCKLQQLAVLVMWGFCAGGTHCRQLALRAGLVSALIQCMRIEIPSKQGKSRTSDDTGPLALRYEAARL